MIRLCADRFDKYGIPILSDRDIRNYAYYVLNDYRPELLNEPGKIDYEEFLEDYVGVKLEYQDIYYDYAYYPILGATAFGNAKLAVFDRENLCVKNIEVEANSVILDHCVAAPGKEGLALFTAVHEAGHALMHTPAFHPGRPHQQKIPLHGIAVPILCCQRYCIETFSLNRERKVGAAWREHQADYFAASLLMPNKTFKPFVQSVMRSYGYDEKVIVLERGMSESKMLAESILPAAISNTYGVSRTAARVKLRKEGLVLDASVISPQVIQSRFIDMPG
jgi:hypothetical protein